MCSTGHGRKDCSQQLPVYSCPVCGSCAQAGYMWNVIPRQPKPGKLGCPCPLLLATLSHTTRPPSFDLRQGLCRPSLDPGVEVAVHSHLLAMPGVLAAPRGARRRVAHAPVLVQAWEPGRCLLRTPHLSGHRRSQAAGKPGQDRHACGLLTQRGYQPSAPRSNLSRTGMSGAALALCSSLGRWVMDGAASKPQSFLPMKSKRLKRTFTKQKLPGEAKMSQQSKNQDRVQLNDTKHYHI